MFPGLDVPAGSDLGIDPTLAHHEGGGASADTALAALCSRVWEAARAGRELTPPQPGDSELGELFDALTAAVIERAAEAVRVGERHRDALGTIAEKDREIAQSSNYAAECEAVVAVKDREIAEVTEYARECEAMIAQKDREIGEVSDYARECEAVVAQKDRDIEELNRSAQRELDLLRGQFFYRLLRKLRLVK